MNNTIEKKLPEGWIEINLKQIVDINYGKSLPKSKRIKGDFPVYGSNGIVGHHNKPFTQNETIIIGRKGSVGKVHLSKIPCWPIDTTYYIDNFAALDAFFMSCMLENLNLEQLESSSAIPGINRDRIYELEVQLPPYQEQKRISNKVEKLLDRFNKVKSRLDKVPAILKRFRQSVLSAAVTGKLTEAWRENNNKDDGKDCLNVIDIELPVGWKTEKIKNFTSKVGSGATPRGGQKVYKKSGTPLIRSQNVYIEGFTEDGLVYLTKKHADELQNVEVHAGDVLLNITGASIGRVTTAPDNMAGARVNQHVCIIRPEKLVSSDFLSIFMASPEMQNYIMKAQYGVTRQALTKVQILDFEIPIPPEPEQKEIMRRIDSLFVLASKIEERLEHTSQYIKKITPSILAKAFRGELVPTEAELARLENRDYETAEQLLERIKSTQKKTRKPKIMKDVFVTNMAFMDRIQPKQEKKERITVTEFKTLYEIILNSKEDMTPEALLDASNYSIDTIEAFYEELAALEKEGKIEDYRPNNRVSLLRVKK